MNTVRYRSAASLALALLLVAAAPDAPPEPAGYRMDDYRAPTPATLLGSRVLSTCFRATGAARKRTQLIFVPRRIQRAITCDTLVVP